jgi:predicted transport protein
LRSAVDSPTRAVIEELGWSYRRFGADLLALELIHSVTVSDESGIPDSGSSAAAKPKAKQADKQVTQAIADLDQPLRDVYEALRAHMLALGDDVAEKTTKLYVAFRRIKNFATVTVQKTTLYVYLKVDPSTVRLEEDFTRDVRKTVHWGTGDLEVTIRNTADLQRAKSLLQQAYAGT